MNRNKVQFIHIPKTGGTFVLNCLFSTNNLIAEHKKIENNNKILLACIRNPYYFYESFFNFFYKPNHKISNQFQFITKQYSNIDIFLDEILNNKKTFFNKHKNKILVEFDKYYFNSNNDYGLLTNYLLYFFNYNGNNESDNIECFLKKIINKVTFLKIENLKEELIEFCKKYNIEYNKNNIDKYINKNELQFNINDKTKEYIYKKDILIFKIFNYTI